MSSLSCSLAYTLSPLAFCMNFLSWVLILASPLGVLNELHRAIKEKHHGIEKA
jgi:hypothetical protein